MEDTVTNPIDKATAAREMLSALRLLAIQGHLSNGRELVERWESALNHGEPGLGRLAAIQGVLEFFDFDLGELVLRHALKRVEQIATGSRTESGTDADGSAYVSAGDLPAVLGALDEASDELRDRAGNCGDCDVTPGGLCATCEGRMDRADHYDAVYAQLGGAL